MALGLPLPEILYVHGYITVDGKKMGKSLGNFISPGDILKKYGTDAFRYFFLRHIPSYEDGDFTGNGSKTAYNNELADQLGNAVQRVAAMVGPEIPKRYDWRHSRPGTRRGSVSPSYR